MPEKTDFSKLNQKHIHFDGFKLTVLDQLALPYEEKLLSSDQPEELNRWIRDMVVRGAPLIGIVGAFSLAFSYREFKKAGLDGEDLKNQMIKARKIASETRPTAVNLDYGLNKVFNFFADNPGIHDLYKSVQSIWDEDISGNLKMGEYGKNILLNARSVLSHCNAGALATGGYGTALGVIRSLHKHNPKLEVYCTETRPYLQGGRLSVYELYQDGIIPSLICESSAASLFAEGKIDAVITGADRIAANGDTANKIGTLSLAIIAKHFNVPFFIAAPLSSFDPNCKKASEIKIEQRSKNEVLCLGNKKINFDTGKVFNPAFDVTPADLIEAYITDEGIFQTPFPEIIMQGDRK